MAKCAKCSKLLGKKNPGAQCHKCNKWYHGSCVSLTTDQLCALSETDSVDWKCPSCMSIGGKKKRISVILPDIEGIDSDHDSVSGGGGQSKMLGEIREEIRQFKQIVRDIIRDELQSSLQYYADKIDEYEVKAKEHETRVKLMEIQCKDISDKCKNLSLKNDLLEQKVAKIEQAQATNDVEICGVAEQENEDVMQVAKSIGQRLHQQPDDVIRAYRKRKPIAPGSQQAERARIDAPITVSLRDGKRDLWCAAAKNTLIRAQDLGGVGEGNVYLRESLTATTSYLLWKTKKTLKESSLCKFVWCKGGQIMVRKKEGDKKIYYVRTENDIDRISRELKKT